nr:PREDICTED: pre-rRNA-processing protein esf1 [Bemisia tabaci]XP_018913036.1 PREDICTED: pre-rRNA-processing protein esf1 [Bemisia tabaci]
MMDNSEKDDRFAHVAQDPKFRRIPKYERKIKIDKRFQSMFTDERFTVNYSVDKRGRPLQKSSGDDFRKYYEISSEESDGDDPEAPSTSKMVKVKKSVNQKKKKDITPRLNAATESDDENSVKMDNLDESIDIDQKCEDDEFDEKNMSSKIRQRLKNMSVDYARGESTLLSDSSSDEESSENDEPDIEHAWGELDRDAERTDEITHRLAACHMDWDRIRAVDLMVLFNSFLPNKGVIQSVTIYPSEFGLKRMQEEELIGPPELVGDKKTDPGFLDKENTSKVGLDADSSLEEVSQTSSENDEDMNSESDGHSDDDGSQTNDDDNNNSDSGDSDDNQEGKKFHMERLRQYQINRLKYYYAVIVFDSAETANKVYTECDGMEFETSSARLDLRFIPDETTFDQEPKEVCTSLPEKGKYKPRYFTTTALQQSKVTLTWDETDPHRSEVMQKVTEAAQKGGDISDDEIHNVLATSSDEDDEGIESAGSDNDHVSVAETTVSKAESIARYRNLIKMIEEEEEQKKNDVEMEISWGVGLKDKAKEMVDKKAKTKLTPFQQLVEKKREKRRLKKEERTQKKENINEESGSDIPFSDDELPSDVDTNDPFFQSEMPKKKKSKKKEDIAKSKANEDEERENNAELELLLMDEGADDNKHHFDMKKIVQGETKKKKKSKSRYKKASAPQEKEPDDFMADVQDERFSALYTSHHFNIDPANPLFKKTKAMEAIISEKQRRRKSDPNYEFEEPGVSKKPKIDSSLLKKDTELSMLVKEIKKKM